MRTTSLAVAIALVAACVDATEPGGSDGAMSAPCSACDDLAAEVFDQPQLGECLVEGAGFLVDGTVAPSESPALTWVANVQGRHNPAYPDLIEDGVIVRHGLLGDCEWLACMAKR